MKKNELIKLLQDITGNPDVLLWNGMVQDWHHIARQPVETSLLKYTYNYYLDTIRWERCRDTNNFDYQLTQDEIEQARKHYLKVDWDTATFVCEGDITNERYREKRVIYLTMKPRGISTYDRAGKISY